MDSTQWALLLNPPDVLFKKPQHNLSSCLADNRLPSDQGLWLEMLLLHMSDNLISVQTILRWSVSPKGPLCWVYVKIYDAQNIICISPLRSASVPLLLTPTTAKWEEQWGWGEGGSRFPAAWCDRQGPGGWWGRTGVAVMWWGLFWLGSFKCCVEPAGGSSVLLLSQLSPHATSPLGGLSPLGVTKRLL